MSEEKHRVVCNLCRKAKSPWFQTGPEADNWVTARGWTFKETEEGIFDICPACQSSN